MEVICETNYWYREYEEYQNGLDYTKYGVDFKVLFSFQIGYNFESLIPIEN